jgi:hypothetical protein
MKIKWMDYPPVVQDCYVEHFDSSNLESHKVESVVEYEVESAVEYLISLAGRMLLEMNVCETVELTQIQ